MTGSDRFKTLVLVLLSGVALIGPQGGHSTTARAAPATSSSTKPPPPDADPRRHTVIDACTRSAYAELATAAVGLRALHGADLVGFERAYAARKAALVGEAELRKRGCARAREE